MLLSSLRRSYGEARAKRLSRKGFRGFPALKAEDPGCSEAPEPGVGARAGSGDRGIATGGMQAMGHSQNDGPRSGTPTRRGSPCPA